MTELLTREDVVDIICGATLFGAGGGGELQEGFDLIDMALAAGKDFRLARLVDMPGEALLCSPYLLGAISDLPEGDDALVDGVHPIQLAYDRAAAYHDDPIRGMIACELGGSNTAVPFFLAAMNDAVVIDADPAGRAVPEITHSTFAMAGLPPAPIFTANAFGETMVLENIADDQRAEDLVRALAQASRNDIAAIDHVLPARCLRGNVLMGTLSAARRLGQLWREARADLATLPQRIAKAASGVVLFEGRVTESIARNEESFTTGHIEIAGNGHFDGSTLRIDLKNENMIGWINGVPAVSIPEIITPMDRQTGDVVTNPNTYSGQLVSVLVLPAPGAFLTAQGLDLFGPRYAGLDEVFRSALAD